MRTVAAPVMRTLPLFEYNLHLQQLNATMPVQEALAEIAKSKPGAKFSYQALAKNMVFAGQL